MVSGEVPQHNPYLGSSSFGEGSDRTVQVAVTEADGTVLSDETHEIPISMKKTGLFWAVSGAVQL
jgi:hypothetical protein